MRLIERGHGEGRDLGEVEREVMDGWIVSKYMEV